MFPFGTLTLVKIKLLSQIFNKLLNVFHVLKTVIVSYVSFLIETDQKFKNTIIYSFLKIPRNAIKVEYVLKVNSVNLLINHFHA